jgi:hypothetical protein
MGIERSGIEARIKSALKKGWSASKWIQSEKDKGRSYRRTDMLADWREVGNIKAREGLAQYVRKGYVPADRTVELKVWNMSKEYMYKIRSETITKTGEKLELKYINIMSNKPLTVAAIEREAFARTFEQSPPESGQERNFIVETVYRRVKE